MQRQVYFCRFKKQATTNPLYKRTIIIKLNSLDFTFFASNYLHMLRYSILILLFVIVSPLSVFAQTITAKSAFRDLRREMPGTWFLPTDRGDKLEIWELENDSTLAGKSVRIKPENGDTVLLERLGLELRDTFLTYIITPRIQRSKEAVTLRFEDIDENGFYVFSNPENDDPTKLKYLLLGNREMQIITESKRNGRIVTREDVYEREFAPGTVEFRVKGGINMQNIRSTGTFNTDPPGSSPEFEWRPGWELGTQIRFKGRGGFVTVNAEIGVSGKYVHAKSEFTAIDDTSIVDYKRDLTYQTAWLTIGLYPEISFGRDSRFSLMAGPYYARLVSSRGKGVDLPGTENKLFKANNDFKKNDVGLQLGFQCKLNFGKKDLGGILGLRANLGLANLDNLYIRYCDGGSSILCNGSVAFQGAALYYSIDLLKL